MTQTRINVITYKNRMEPSRKNLFGLEDASCAIFGGWGLQKHAVDSPGSLATTCLPLGEVCWLLTCLAPSKVWGIGVGFRSGLGRSLYLPCLGSLFYPTCVAWLACLEYLAGLYLGILRLPIGPLLGGHCLGSLQVQCEAWDTTGTTYFSFCDFRFSGLSFTQHVGGD